ncbi:hypothetical protein PAPYR_3735 [Paratrimastix pyriformis]|uniref:Ankyrin repeat domain-containing protein n=1 Tax=Paratrimastix pyriformis TaxID=342808 RepID=A0ABQ8UP04_9EUKA|nr:hypothetical protein PAPYR_3735 [Paratrimastix pyriformis]
MSLEGLDPLDPEHQMALLTLYAFTAAAKGDRRALETLIVEKGCPLDVTAHPQIKAYISVLEDEEQLGAFLGWSEPFHGVERIQQDYPIAQCALQAGSPLQSYKQICDQSPEPHLGDTLLHFALRCGQNDSIAWLAHHGADLGKCNQAGETPLTLAVSLGLSEFLLHPPPPPPLPEVQEDDGR